MGLRTGQSAHRSTSQFPSGALFLGRLPLLKSTNQTGMPFFAHGHLGVTSQIFDRGSRTKGGRVAVAPRIASVSFYSAGNLRNPKKRPKAPLTPTRLGGDEGLGAFRRRGAGGFPNISQNILENSATPEARISTKDSVVNHSKKIQYP